MYAKVAELPDTIRQTLSNLGYHRKDIFLSAKEEVSPSVCGGDGKRGFCIILNVSTGKKKKMWGSWGGSNMFNPNNQVDLDTNMYKIPDDFCVITGTIGNGTYAELTVNPNNMLKALPEAPDISDRDKWILYTFKGLTSAGRKNEWNREDDIPTEDDLNRLASAGYLKRSKNGATRITTEGKNIIINESYIRHPNSNR